MQETKPTGIILAGGKSIRMGEDKALLKIGNSTFIESIYNTLKPICSELIISTNNPQVKIKGIESIPDEIENIGPMGGIYTCLKYSKSKKNIIISVDTPFINTELLQYLLERSKETKVTICKHYEKLHPLIGIYSVEFLKILEKDISEENYKTILAVKKSNHSIINITRDLPFYHPGLFLNINNPEDLKRADNLLL